MSTIIDQKVVEMKFDNRDFEKNTRQTMSTLEKLKSLLHFKGASDGLTAVGEAAKKVKMDGLADGIQTVTAKFSAMEIVGTTALVNLTNAAINAGTNIVKSLTVDPVTAGWNKMNQKIGSVQTLVNSTGLSVDQIDGYLDQLMWYSDETSYSFTDMTAALANMTATGGDIKNLIPMLRGMANATAFAGKGAAEFSRIIYNLNQSYGSGALTLMDWKSVQLAGVNSKQLTQELIRAGEELGTIKKGQINIGNFNDSLQDKWATTKVMEKAFGNFDKLSAAAYEAVKNGEYDTASEAIEALSKNFDELAVSAFRSAQEAKSFKEAINSAADATSSGWMKIFSNIFGNYNKQKEIFTSLANFLYDVFVSPLEKIEEITRHAFGFDGLTEMWDKLTNNGVVKTMNGVIDTVNKANSSLEEYQNIVSKVWRGDYNNQPVRFGLLEADGWDPRVVQELVNQTDAMAGYGKGWTVIDQLTKDDLTKAQQKYGIVITETTESIEKQIDSINNLSEEKLKALGLSEEEIRMYQSLQRASKKYGLSIDAIVEKMNKANGRDLLFGRKGKDADGNEIYEVEGIFQNIAGFLGNIAKSIGKAWSSVFAPFGGAELYMAISNLNEFTKRLKEMTELSDKNQNMKNLTDTFRGLFSVLKLFTTIASGGLSIVWTIFKTVLQTLGVSVLDVTGFIGNLTATVVDFITKNKWLIDGVVWLTKTISGAIISVHKFISNWLSVNKIFDKVKENLKEFVLDLKKFLEGLKTADNIPKYIFDGIIKGINKWGGKALNGISEFANAMLDKFGEKLGINRNKNEGFFSFGVNIVKGLVGGIKSESGKGISAIIDWATNILGKFAEKLGIHSPSTEFFTFGGNIVQGLFNGIASMVGIVYKLITTIGGKLIEIVKDLDLGTMIAALISAGAIFGLIKLSQAINILANGLQNVNEVIGNFALIEKAFAGVLKAAQVKLITSALKDVAISVAILVGSIWLLTTLNTGKVWASIGAIAALVAIMGLLVISAGSFGKGQALEFGKLALTVLAVGVAMGFMARALKKIADIKDISWTAIGLFAAMLTSLIAIAFVAGRAKSDLLNLGGILLSVGAALYVMSMVAKKLGKMDPKELKQGIMGIIAFTAIVIGLMSATKLMGDGDIKAMGGMLMAVGVAFYLMSMTVKRLGRMRQDEISQGIMAITLFTGLIVSLIAATKLIGGVSIAAIGGTLMATAAAILIMGLTVRLLGGMKPEDITKGTIVVGLFAGMIVGLIASLKIIAGKDIAKIGATLLGISAVMAVMALTTILLGMVSIPNLIKGIIAVGLLTYFVAGLVKSTENAKDLGKTLWPMVGIIIALAAAVGILSIIDPERLVGPTIALGILMGMVSLLIKATGSINTGNVKDMMIKLGAVMGVVGILAMVIWRLSLLDTGEALNATMSISILLGAVIGTMFIISKIKVNPKDLLMGLGGMAAVILALVPLVVILSKLAGVEKAVPTIIALGGFIGMLTLMLLGIAATGVIYAATGGLGLLGLVGLYAILPALLAIVGILAVMSKVPDAAKSVILLSGLLKVLTGMLVVLGTVGVLATVGVAGLYALLALIMPLMLFCTAIGALVTYIPMLEQFLNKGLKILISVAGGLGEMIGAFVSGVLTKLSAGLPEIGLNLSQFMINATPFIVGMKMVNGQTLAGVGILTAAILMLTAADFINGIFTFLSGGNSFSRLGMELSLFAKNAEPFFKTMATIPSAAMNGIKSLSIAILSLTSANLLDGLSRFFGGGGASLASFGNQLPPLGTALSAFVSNLGTFSEDQVTATDCAGRAVSALAEAAKNLPKEGGWAQKIFGASSLADFADAMPTVARGVVNFVKELGTFSNPQIQTAKAAGEVIIAIAKASEEIKGEGGWAQKIFGSSGNGLAQFADNMPKVGAGVKGFINELESVKDKADVAKSAANVIESIAKLADLDLNKANKKLPSFGDKMNEFGGKLRTFINNFKNISSEDVSNVNNNLGIVVSAVENMINTINNTANNNSDKVITTMEEIGNKSAKALGSKSIMDELTKQGRNFVLGFSNSIKANQGLAKDAASNMTQFALDAIPKIQNSHSPSKETFSLGSDFGEGYVMAISSYASKAYNVSSSVGEEAKKGLSESVSKMSSLIESDIDTNPTIRPVLDLSEISKGAGRINSMFGNPSMQLAANLNSISSGMKNKNQNGNSEVVSAIDKLGKNLGGSGDTYNINGITYGADGEVSEAIAVLLRAARVERRS